MEEFLDVLEELAKRILPKARGFQRQCLDEALYRSPKLRERLRTLEGDRNARNSEFVEVVLLFENGGVLRNLE